MWAGAFFWCSNCQGWCVRRQFAILESVHSWFMASCFLAFTSACGVGDVDEPAVTAIDASLDVDLDGATVLADAQVEDPDCLPAAAPNGNGNHNAGANCSSQNCHGGPGAAPNWTLAGTLYTDLAGTGVVAGGTLIFTDADNNEIQLVTASNGNFYTLEPVVFPVAVKASRCPNSLSMTAPIAENMGSCNQGGCHDSGKRIYLPE